MTTPDPALVAALTDATGCVFMPDGFCRQHGPDSPACALTIAKSPALAAYLANRDAEKWGEGYGTGVHDENTAADLGYEFGGPARVNPYPQKDADR